jgi:hypothetical protein
MNLRKKGTEKPIEIFVALFIILAVGLVMLKLFQNQLQQKQGELANVEQEQRIQQIRETATLFCSQKCAEAATNRCSRASLASLCMSYASSRIPNPNWLDININGKKDVDLTLMGGIGVCESDVPCFALIDTCCSQPINPRSCLDIMLDYWYDDLGMDSSFVNNTINRTMSFGNTSTDCVTTGSTMWYELGGNTYDCTYAELATGKNLTSCRFQ